MKLRAALDVAGMIVLVLLALTPVSAAFGDVSFWIAAIGGTAIGAALAVGGARWHWHPLTVAAATVVAYFLFGGVLVFSDASLLGLLPTIDVLSALASGAVLTWKQALTLETPFAGFDQLGILPFLTALVTSVLAVSLALRLRRWFALALLGPAVLLVLSILFSTYRGLAPGLVGASWGALALGWVVWRVRREASAVVSVEQGHRPVTRGRGGRAGMLAGAIVLVALFASAASATAMTVADRDVLRDHIVPPLDLHDYASPLTSYRKYTRDGEDTTLLTVSGLPSGVRVRLAALDFYDGVVYQVSGSGGAGAGVFARVGRSIDAGVAGDDATVRVRIGALPGVWVPTVGYSSGISFSGEDAAERMAALHYNAATGTAVVTDALVEGDEYVLDAVIPAVPSEDELAQAQIADVSTPAPGAVPDEVSGLLDEITEGAATPIEQVRAIEAYFQTEGYFSSGLEGQVTSRSGHTLERESVLLGGSQMVGDGEQYSVAMALMVAQLGIPVRVVMGFAPTSEAETIDITGDDLQAWVEVPFQDYGWIAFSPTPSKDREPQQETPQQAQKPQAQVAQPPQTPQEPAELPPETPVQDAASQDEIVDMGWLWATVQIGAGALALLLILFGPALAFALARAHRRRRRRTRGSSVERVDGGWAELVDAATDVGAPVGAGGTRREQATVLDERYPAVAVVTLAARADAVVFGPGDAPDAEAAAYWADVESARQRIRRSVPWRRRLRGFFYPASLWRRRPRKGRAS